MANSVQSAAWGCAAPSPVRHHTACRLHVFVLLLQVCADTIVGNEMIRGISGGQKKRVTTGEMIVGPCKTLFLDEVSLTRRPAAQAACSGVKTCGVASTASWLVSRTCIGRQSCTLRQNPTGCDTACCAGPPPPPRPVMQQHVVHDLSIFTGPSDCLPALPADLHWPGQQQHLPDCEVHARLCAPPAGNPAHGAAPASPRVL